MKKIILLILILPSIGNTQIKNVLIQDMHNYANAVNSKDGQQLLDFFTNEKDIKKLFTASDETDYEKIRFRYGQHLGMTPEQFSSNYLRKLNKYSKYPTLKPYLLLYKTDDMNKEKKTFLSLYLKDLNGSLYYAQLKSKKIDNEVFYSPKEEILKLKQEQVEEFNNEVIPLINKQNSDYSKIEFESTQEQNISIDDIPFALLDEKPQFNNNESLGVFTKKLKAKAMLKILKDQDLKNELKGTQRVMVSMLVTSDKKFDDIYIKTNSDNLKKVIEDLMAEQTISNEGKKNGASVNSKISFPLILKIN